MIDKRRNNRAYGGGEIDERDKGKMVERTNKVKEAQVIMNGR